MSNIIYIGERCILRPLSADDSWSIAQYANNYNVWRNLRGSFPHPYTIEDADNFIAYITSKQGTWEYALVCGGEAIGVVSAAHGVHVGQFTSDV